MIQQEANFGNRLNKTYRNLLLIRIFKLSAKETEIIPFPVLLSET